MDLSGPNDQRVITRDHVNRFRRTLDALEAEDDGGCNCRGRGLYEPMIVLNSIRTKNIL
jgi:hypothetical protein